MHIQDRDRVAGAAVTDDPRGRFRANAWQSAQSVAECDIIEIALVDFIETCQRSGQVLRPLAREAITHRAAANRQRFKQHGLQLVLRQIPCRLLSERFKNTC